MNYLAIFDDMYQVIKSFGYKYDKQNYQYIYEFRTENYVIQYVSKKLIEQKDKNLYMEYFNTFHINIMENLNYYRYIQMLESPTKGLHIHFFKDINKYKIVYLNRGKQLQKFSKCIDYINVIKHGKEIGLTKEQYKLSIE